MSSPAARPATVIPDWSPADRLRKIRRDVLGIEQAEMAEKLEVTRQAYQSWESGRSNPRDIVSLAKRIELLCGVPASWTLGIHSPTPDGEGSYPTNPLGNRHLALVTALERDERHVAQTAAA